MFFGQSPWLPHCRYTPPGIVNSIPHAACLECSFLAMPLHIMLTSHVHGESQDNPTIVVLALSFDAVEGSF